MHVHSSALLTFIDPQRFHSCLRAVNPSLSFSYIAGLKRSTPNPPSLSLLNLALNRKSLMGCTHTHTLFHNLPQHKAEAWRSFYDLPIIIMSCWWTRSISVCALSLSVWLLLSLCLPFSSCFFCFSLSLSPSYFLWPLFLCPAVSYFLEFVVYACCVVR